MLPVPQKIISGAQTGVDRAALDVALELGIPCGGWCPKGRRAEDGPIPDKYPMQETGASNYTKRTKLNVLDSDGTLIINRGELDGGTAHTVRLAEKMAKPCLVIQLEDQPDLKKITNWLTQNDIKTLNIAGPREDKRPGIYKQTISLLKKLLLEK